MNGTAHWQSCCPKEKMKRTHQCTKVMAKEMKKAVSRIIDRKKSKKKMIMKIGITLTIVIQSAHLLKRTSRPSNKCNNKDRSPFTRKGNLTRQITWIP